MSEINAVKLSKDNILAAIEFLTEYNVDLEVIDRVESGIELAEMTMVLCNQLESHVLNVIAGNKTNKKSKDELVGKVTIDSLVADLRFCNNLLTKVEAFGTTRLSIQTMKSVRKQTKDIKNIALSINVDTFIHSARNEI